MTGARGSSTQVADRPSPAGKTRVSVPAAILTGVLAVGAALGVSNFVAGIVNPPSTPFLAVGNAAIDRTPKGLREFGISTFGANDKPVLLLGVAIAMVILGVVAGLISRRSATPGIALVGLLGVVGLLAVHSRPNTTTAGLLSPVVAVVAGVGVLLLLRRVALSGQQSRRRTGTAESSVDDSAADGAHAVSSGSHGLSRRGFIGTSAGVAVVAAGAGYAGQRLGSVNVGGSQASVGDLKAADPLPKLAANADFTKDNGLPFITSNKDFYRVDTALGKGPALRAQDWSLRIHGMVDKEITLSFDELVSRKLIQKRLTFTCISYVIGSQLVSTADWVGVSLADLLAEAKPQKGAEQLFSTSADGYTASTPLDAAMDSDRGSMLAVNMNGVPLPQEHGFPVRMIVPGFYGYCSATKWLVDLEVTTFAAKQAYWTPRGYAKVAPVKIGSKIVFPQGLSAPIPQGTVIATGTAWAQPNGVKKVETKLDDGPWTETRLGADQGPSTWRMWRIDLPKVSAGNHFLTVRATDGKGTPQTEKMTNVLPDGQSGYQQINFSVK
ncbi:MAG: molybdopterin-dependent oxidoreductase [Actinomycetota bacterium]|nr:molybdopterin-dependent oxidoreductase [Actinomycetota bacterium]